MMQEQPLLKEVVRIMNLGLNWILKLRTWMRSAYIRAKNDGKELLKSISKWKNAQKKEGKPVNVWVAAFTIIIVILALFLVLPMILGVIEIVFQEANPDTVPSISHEALTGLILVSTGLGAFMLWFTAASNKSNKGRIKDIGKLFLFAALAFSLFMLLSPLLPDIRSNTDSYSNFLKYAATIFLIGGGLSFAWAALLGLVYLWKF